MTLLLLLLVTSVSWKQKNENNVCQKRFSWVHDFLKGPRKMNCQSLWPHTATLYQRFCKILTSKSTSLTKFSQSITVIIVISYNMLGT